MAGLPEGSSAQHAALGRQSEDSSSCGGGARTFRYRILFVSFALDSQKAARRYAPEPLDNSQDPTFGFRARSLQVCFPTLRPRRAGRISAV